MIQAEKYVSELFNNITIESDKSTVSMERNLKTALDKISEFDAQKTFLAAPASGGGLAQTNSTLTNYAASILSNNSSGITTLDQERNFQEQLTSELYNRHTSSSGVNMDEELANMIIIEQSYLAAARIITTTQGLFKVLNDMMR